MSFEDYANMLPGETETELPPSQPLEIGGWREAYTRAQYERGTGETQKMICEAVLGIPYPGREAFEEIKRERFGPGDSHCAAPTSGVT